MNTKSKVFLIYPPAHAANMSFPPMDLMYMAATAEQYGCEAKIKDYSQGGDFIADLKKFQPHYLVASVATETFLSDMDWIKKAKEAIPSLITIVKGTPFLTYNTNAIYENTFLDYVIVGEAEFSLRDILSGVPDNEILGVCYRENFQAAKTDNRPFIENLDLIPFPARHLVDNSKYINQGKVQAVIEITRGCPFDCFFCLAKHISGTNVRIRSVESIIAEIKECAEKYNIKNFFFQADIFNFDREWVMNLCKKIIESRLKITWSANIHPNIMDEELAKLMHQSGCRLVYIGVESGSQKILDHIGKKLKLDDIRNAVKILRKHKIKIHSNFIIGLPWETEETVEETIKFAIELDSSFVNFYTAAPFPGTKFFNHVMLNKLIEGGLDFKNAYKSSIVKSQILSKERLSELRKSALKRFYSRPKYFLRNILQYFRLLRR